jgi:hypothetical protein
MRTYWLGRITTITPATRFAKRAHSMGEMAAISEFTPCWDDIEALYDPAKERIRHPEYRADLQLRNLQR